MSLLVLVIAGHQRRDLGVEFCAENTFKVCLLGPKQMPILLVNNFNTTRKSPQNGFLTLARRTKIAQKFRILRSFINLSGFFLPYKTHFYCISSLQG